MFAFSVGKKSIQTELTSKASFWGPGALGIDIYRRLGPTGVKIEENVTLDVMLDCSQLRIRGISENLAFPEVFVTFDISLQMRGWGAE